MTLTHKAEQQQKQIQISTTVWFDLIKVQKKVKLIYAVRSHDGRSLITLLKFRGLLLYCTVSTVEVLIIPLLKYDFRWKRTPQKHFYI